MQTSLNLKKIEYLFYTVAKTASVHELWYFVDHWHSDEMIEPSGTMLTKMSFYGSILVTG